jgi:hypothetical protein
MTNRASEDAKETVYSMPLAELERRIGKAVALAQQIRELLPGLELMPADERRHSPGRFRDGEVPALASVLDVVRHAPALFNSLADADEGHHPDKFEVPLVEDRMQRRELFQRLETSLEPIHRATGDVTLHMGALTKPVLLAAYRIAKTVSATDKVVRQKLAPALDFYGRIARSGAATREAKKSDPATG